MAYFEIQKKIQLARTEITIEDINRILLSKLDNYFTFTTITGHDNGFELKGDLKGVFERALIHVSLETLMKDEILHCQASGNVRFGKWPWVWFFIGLFSGLPMGLFLVMLGEYLLSRNKPKTCFEDVFNTLQLELS